MVEADVGQRRLADLAGYKQTRSIRKALALLEQCGAISITQAGRERSRITLAPRLETASDVPTHTAAAEFETGPDVPRGGDVWSVSTTKTGSDVPTTSSTEETRYSCAPHDEYLSCEEGCLFDSSARVDSDIPLACAGDAASPPRDDDEKKSSTVAARDAARDSLLVAKNGDEDDDAVLVPPPVDLRVPVAADTPQFDAFGYPITPDAQDEIEQRVRAAKFRALRDLAQTPRLPEGEDQDAA